MTSFIADGTEFRFFDHIYAVSRCGKVLRKLMPYRPAKHNLGYLALGRHRLMHRVVATCWLEKPEGANHVHHINGIKTDNRAENLTWVNPKEHMGRLHSFAGKHKRSPETCEKLRVARLGKRDTLETIAKKRAAFEAHRETRRCRFNGVEYPRILDGAIAAGLKYQTFRVRCLSKNFPDYELL